MLNKRIDEVIDFVLANAEAIVSYEEAIISYEVEGDYIDEYLVEFTLVNGEKVKIWC